uniref:Gustatory receptor n=1 Tax=Anopheles christyi TaxID=43041 RepID=A0A182KIM9_9DIPT
MHVFNNLNILIRPLQFLGLVSLQKCQREDGSVTPPFKSNDNAGPKFAVLCTIFLLASGYSIYFNIVDSSTIGVINKGSIWSFVYLVHQITMCAVFCSLPWQTFWKRKQLAAAMNILYQNERNLIERTGNSTDYRTVSMLVLVIICNGFCLHLFYQTFYIAEYNRLDKPFLPLYFTSCIFMYADLAIELLLGLCDCLLLIARLQLQRLVWMARDLGRGGNQDEDFLSFYSTTYYNVVIVLRDHLSPYFGLTVLLHCSYVCFESAICILDTYNLVVDQYGCDMRFIAYIVWPLSDVKKLTALFLLGEGLNGMSMQVFDNVRVLIRCLQLIGQLSIQNHATDDGLFRSIRHAKVRFTLFFTASVLASVHLMYRSIEDYDMLSVDGIIWPLVYVVNNATFCAVLCALPWQAFRHRDRLAAALNALHQNELCLIELTGTVTDYRMVKLLVIVIVCNGVLFHTFFHTYYVVRNHSFDYSYLFVYIMSWTFMYFDLAIELVLGLCDCMLLIARIQLERLVWIVKNRNHTIPMEHVLHIYIAMYNKITDMLRNNLSSYFGPLILLHCAFVCLEAAVCILDANSSITRHHRTAIIITIANILWPLSDVKKLAAIFLLGEGLNGMYESMDVFVNLRGLIRCLRFLGLFSVHQSSAANNSSFESTRHAALKFIIFFTLTLACSGYSMYRNIIDYPTMVAIDHRTIEPFFFIVHSITFCAVLLVLPWQTVHDRQQLSILMNVLNKNEVDLVMLSGGLGTNYRIITMLETVCLWNGVLFHVFFHIYYIDEFRGFGDLFLPLYIVSWFFLYIDLAMELLLGLCDCLPLIVQLQLERLATLVRDMEVVVDPPEGFFLCYEITYNRTVFALRNNLSRYFGPVLAVFCTYVSLEVAVCILAIVGSTSSFLGHSQVYNLAIVLWPLTDVKKLVTVFLLNERTKLVYDEKERSFRQPTAIQFAAHFLYVRISDGFLLYCIWQQYSIFAVANFVFDDATFILSTASFSVVWMVFTLFSYTRCAQLIYALNILLKNHADLSHVTGNARKSDQLPYHRQAKWFGWANQCESVACCLLLGSGYIVLYSFQPEYWYTYITVAIFLYVDVCL